MSALTSPSFLISIIGALALSFTFAWLVRHAARRLGVVDDPSRAPDRKQHATPTPLLGGVAIFLALAVTVALLLAFAPDTLAALPRKALVALAVGSLLIVIGGILDDVRPQTPGRQLLWPMLAALVAIAGGIGVRYITNPLGGVLWLDQVRWTVLTWDSVPYHLTLFADLFTFLWILGMVYTTKLLDGLDGLVAGVTAIGGLIVAIVSLRPEVDQPATALLALVLSASCLGFLPWNWSPARLYLGESGALLTGFALGVLAIISGGKIATALLIMGLPILDVAWVIARRLFLEHRSPFRTADRKHLHFRLLDAGLSARQAVLLLYTLTALFGSATLFVHGPAKLLVLGLLFLLTIALGVILVRRARARVAAGSTASVDRSLGA